MTTLINMFTKHNVEMLADLVIKGTAESALCTFFSRRLTVCAEKRVCFGLVQSVCERLSGKEKLYP